MSAPISQQKLQEIEETLLRAFNADPVLPFSALRALVGEENVPAMEEAIYHMIQKRLIKVAAMPATPMSHIDPQSPTPQALAGEVYFRVKASVRA